MPLKDQDKQVSVVAAIPARNNTLAGSGSTVDRVGYETAVFVVTGGAYGGGDGTQSVSVLESADGIAWTVPASTDLSGTSPAALTSTSKVALIGYLGSKRYLSAVASAANAASNSQSYSVDVWLAHPRTRP